MPRWPEVQKDWRDEIRVGDVLIDPSGNFRAVRKLSRSCKRSKTSFFVYFSIKRCSWTTRPYTIYTRSDLKQWSPTGVNVTLDGEIDIELEKSFGADIKNMPFYCCDAVKAMP